MNETDIFNGLWESIFGGGSVPVIIGYVLLALCVVAKFFLEGKAHGKAKAWLGAVIGTVFGAAAALAAGGEWQRTTVIALLGGAASTGLLSLIKGTIPEFGKPTPVPEEPPPAEAASDGPQTPYSPPQEGPTP